MNPPLEPLMQLHSGNLPLCKHSLLESESTGAVVTPWPTTAFTVKAKIRRHHLLLDDISKIFLEFYSIIKKQFEAVICVETNYCEPISRRREFGFSTDNKH